MGLTRSKGEGKGEEQMPCDVRAAQSLARCRSWVKMSRCLLHKVVWADESWSKENAVWESNCIILVHAPSFCLTRAKKTHSHAHGTRWWLWEIHRLWFVDAIYWQYLSPGWPGSFQRNIDWQRSLSVVVLPISPLACMRMAKYMRVFISSASNDFIYSEHVFGHFHCLIFICLDGLGLTERVRLRMISPSTGFI